MMHYVAIGLRVEEGDILEAGRLLHGLERMNQMKFAVLERDGAISVIPKIDQESGPSRA